MSSRVKLPILYLIEFALFTCILAVDLFVPLGVADGVLYITVVLFHNFTISNNSKHIVGVSILSACLVIIGYYYSPSGGEAWKVLANRFLSVYVIWITAYLLLRINKQTKIKVAIERSSAQEKEVLLSEIHHRVKNNLQMIISLMSLQSGFLKDKKTKAIFLNSQHRIYSMGIVHETLCKSGDLSKIDYKTYLHNMTQYLVNSFHGPENNIDIDLKSNDVSFNLDTAIPLGLLITEILTNSFKHGLVNGSGAISIKIEQLNYPNYTMEISDNGVGYSNELNFSNAKSLGLRLIQQLVQQINGSIEKDDSKSGTNYLISFQEIEQTDQYDSFTSE